MKFSVLDFEQVVGLKLLNVLSQGKIAFPIFQFILVSKNGKE